MSMKQLTIAVPAYNAEQYIEKCLDSMVNSKSPEGISPDPRLEVIVINDGSKDKTEEKAKEYEKRFPNIVKVISKENGGHGSGINTGIKEASGRYFKVVDSDDWVETENIPDILDALEKIDADVVVTGYKSINERTGRVQEYSTSCDYVNTVIGMEEFTQIFQNIGASYQFHGLCYRTDFYRGLDLRLSEKVSYEDQEYAVLPFAKAKTIVILSYFFYVYRLGSSGQTVDYKNQASHAEDMKLVIKRMVDYHIRSKHEAGNWSEAREKFFVQRLSMAAASYYAAVLVKSPNKANGKKLAAGFRQYLENSDPAVAKYSESKYKKLQKAAKMPFAAALYGKAADMKSYQKLKSKWVK